MLIKCPECNHEVSTFAETCPNCGYPIKKKSRSSSSKKFHRNPNGFGTIRKLQGNRRRPFAVYPHVTGYKEDGSPILDKAIGYYETYQQAFQALSDFNRNPYDTNNKDITFKEVFDLFYEDKYVKNTKREFSQSTLKSVRFGFNNVSSIHNKPIKLLRANDYQAILDGSTLKHASLEQMLHVIKWVNEYALAHDFIQKDYSVSVKINIADDDEIGVPFTDDEIKVLWEHSSDKSVRVILIMIYSGLRISEFCTIDLHIDEHYMQGGLKTKAGKNRIIPIHDSIYDFVKEFDFKNFKPSAFRVKCFYPTLEELGMQSAKTGARHTPHDCRHTFSWLADKYGMDSLSKHLIMGHSVSGMDIETSVYGHRTIDQLVNEMQKIIVN